MECKWAFRSNYQAIFALAPILSSLPSDYSQDLVSSPIVVAFALLIFQPTFLLDTQSLHSVGSLYFFALPCVNVQRP